MDDKARLAELRKKAAPVVTLLENGLMMECYSDWVSAAKSITGDEETAREAVRAAKELLDHGMEPPVDDPTDDELFPNFW